ncbi:zinc-ribbon domain-containing protein [Slackia heliotrinireducens]|uniref:zinc-ribbon domain-containing protein n=1 Tax=Slackia heliotrinireducens TaxID=84110 RepID=UPI00331617BD
MYCPHCGATLPDGSQFCGSCGKRLNVTATPAAMPAPKKKTPIVPILAGVLGAAIVIGAGVFAYQNFFAGIAINEENFPDKAVIKFVEKQDENDNGRLTSKEAEAVTKIDLSRDVDSDDTPATDLTGLDVFVNAKRIDVSGNELEGTVDFSGFAHLTKVDVSDNTGDLELVLPDGFDEADLETGDSSITYTIGDKTVRKIACSYVTEYVDISDKTDYEDSWYTAFTYPVLSCDAYSKHIDQLNEENRVAVQEAAERYLTDDVHINGDDGLYYLNSNIYVGHLDERAGVVSFVTDVYEIGARSAHGMTYRSGRIVDLSTGEELTAAEYLGISQDELDSMTQEACRTFVSLYGSDIYEPEIALDNFFSLIRDGSIPYLLLDEGVVAFAPDYALGSYAYGNHLIMVAPSADSTYAAGDEIFLECPDENRVIWTEEQ